MWEIMNISLFCGQLRYELLRQIDPDFKIVFMEISIQNRGLLAKK
jgi:hypothetical protein